MEGEWNGENDKAFHYLWYLVSSLPPQNFQSVDLNQYRLSKKTNLINDDHEKGNSRATLFTTLFSLATYSLGGSRNYESGIMLAEELFWAFFVISSSFRTRETSVIAAS